MILSRYPFTNQDGNADEIFRDETTNKKIHRHLSDKNDVISEEDIRNVRTDFLEKNTVSAGDINNQIPGEEIQQLAPPGKGEKIIDKKDGEDQNNDRSFITPWDVIDG